MSKHHTLGGRYCYGNCAAASRTILKLFSVLN